MTGGQPGPASRSIYRTVVGVSNVLRRLDHSLARWDRPRCTPRVRSRGLGARRGPPSRAGCRLRRHRAAQGLDALIGLHESSLNPVPAGGSAYGISSGSVCAANPAPWFQGEAHGPLAEVRRPRRAGDGECVSARNAVKVRCPREAAPLQRGAGSNSSMRLPAGSVSRIWCPPGPAMTSLRKDSPASRSR